jgi:hypothetical protein
MTIARRQNPVDARGARTGVAMPRTWCYIRAMAGTIQVVRRRGAAAPHVA